MAVSVLQQVDPFYMAINRARQRRFQESADLCSDILDANPYDQAVWFLKCRVVTQQTYIDDSEMEEEGAADLLLDDNALASMPRPGTSLARPMTRANSSSGDQSFRPMSASGRPLSGFARPGTGSRPGTGMSLDQAMQGARPGTSRPPTSLGRQVRLGTASMQNQGDMGVFINPDRLDMKRYAARAPIAKVLVDYLLYHDHNPKKALELAAEATVAADYKDWWWKARLGKCYYQLGLLRDAEKQFESSLRSQEMVITYLELCKVYMKLDQPNTALEYYKRASAKFPGDVHVLVGMARIHDMLNDVDNSVDVYKKVLEVDPANIEAIACLASNNFYNDHPEVALRYYRRLLQMDVNNTELWCNIGLCCFYASQYDMTLSCFERALAMASDDNMADVWYNIGQVAIGIGDLGLAYQAFKIAVSVDANHAESYNNLGVLELRKGNVEQARANFQLADNLANFMFEPSYNRALLAYKIGDFQDAYTKVTKALQVYPDHADSMELKRQLEQFLTMI
ncbi:sporangia induced TRP protein [Achlya hypogyna]|uniref:Sporangia induced TRP protein n=1 Tax=Achlya hypogyna TaxID=1202772 RepID=A0A1V9YW63_ACHHY|nr:sporangia induced TRP protein [Achlya hypogyna]